MKSLLRPSVDLALKFFLNFNFLLVLIFSIFHFVPGAYIDDEHIVETVQRGLPPTASATLVSNLKQSLYDFYTLNFGVSYQNHNAQVLDLILKKATFSFQYLGFAILVVFSFAILISFLIMKSRKKNLILKVFVGINLIPQLVLIPGIIYFFAYFNSLVPLKFDARNPICVFFVVGTMALKPLSQLIHFTVEKWRKENEEMYAQFARAKGLRQNRVLLIHTFKNVGNSFLGYFLTVVLHLFTGNFILESLYSIPGFGLGFMDSVLQRDLPLVIGFIFLFSCIYLALHFIVQILFLYVNPRLRGAI